MTSKKPSRGVLDGIRNDAKRAKDTGETYNPNGAGVAWSHNFLNQKPWHPLNFRNQKARFDAQEKAYKDAKANQIAQREFEEEQSRLHNSSFLNEADRQRYSEIQSVSFMYTKPPGMDAAIQRDNVETKTEEGAAGTSGAQEAQKQQQGGQDQAPRPQRPLHIPKIDAAGLLSAKEALAAQNRIHLKHAGGLGYRSPTHGGITDEADNQQYLVGGSSEEEEEEEEEPSTSGAPQSLLLPPGGGVESELDSMFATLSGPEGLEGLVADLPDKQRRRILRAYAEWTVGFQERQRSAAKAFLKSAGYKSEKSSKKSKKESKEKHKKRHKKSKKSHHKREERTPESSSSGEDAEELPRHQGSKRQRRDAAE